MITLIVTNNDDFTRICTSLEEAYKALGEAHDLLSDDHIHIEFCHRDKVGNNCSLNYEAIIWNKDITRF